MSATYEWSESNGAGEVVTDDISNVNFGNSDAANLASPNNRIIAGANSYEKYIRMLFSGVYTEISNILFWKSAGVLKASEEIKAAANVAYAAPVATASATATVDVPVTEGTGLSVNSYEDETSIVSADSGVSGYTDYICLQMQLGALTPGGALNQKTFTMQWDEV